MRYWTSLPTIALVLAVAGGAYGALSSAYGAQSSAYSAQSSAYGAQKGEKKMEFKLTSSAFEEGEYIPKKYTGEGQDVSPPLKWANPPEGTESFALIADDPDAPRGTWVHWVLWNIPPDKRELPENVPAEKKVGQMRHGTTDFNRVGYGGPMPPKGSDHRYYFKLYALDTELDLEPGKKKADLLKAMDGHILADTKLMGRYRR